MSATEPPTESPPQAAPRSARMIAVALVAGILLLLAIWEWPSEMERWRQMRAVSARAAGNKDEAYRLLSASIDRDPKNASLRLLRADWRLTDEEPEAALEDLNAAVADHPQDLQLLNRRGTLLQTAGKHAAAIDDWQKVLDGVTETNDRARMLHLNNVAYARAVGEIDPERGLKQINEAFKLIESTAKPSRSNEQDTRGFLLYRLGKFEEALQDLDPAVEEAEEELLKELKDVETIKPALRKRGTYERYMKELRRPAAVIRYHRGLTLEKLEEPEKAEADFARVRELGFEPNEKLW